MRKQSRVHPWIPLQGLPTFTKIWKKTAWNGENFAPYWGMHRGHSLCPPWHIFIFYVVCPAGQGRFKALHDCEACPPGTYHNGSVIQEPQYCVNCSINTFSPHAGASACQPCLSGFITESTGAKNCGKNFIHRPYVESQKISISGQFFIFLDKKGFV